MTDKRSISFGILAAGLIVAAGCSGGKDKPKTYAVSGTVMYKGKPVEGATVSFMGKEASQPATGVTDAQGKFQLSTYAANDGAILGEHVVTITKIEGGAQPAGDPTASMNDPTKLANMGSQAGAQKNKGPKSLLPAKYGSTTSSPFKKTVTAEGPNEFVFQLTD